tara:strand:- start:32866 stop:33387 length:522 start_codon:yes stop_codon:yes gene_type:complete
MDKEKIINSIRTIPDFPVTGIQFKDITTLLMDIDAFKDTINILSNHFRGMSIDTILGIESRGFIFGAPLALELNCPFAIARKPGKLPGETISIEYDLEYGTDKIEIHKDVINEHNKVLIVDDLIATGGTAKAVGKLVKSAGGIIVSYAFLINLIDLKGKDDLAPDPVFSVLNI